MSRLHPIAIVRGSRRAVGVEVFDRVVELNGTVAVAHHAVFSVDDAEWDEDLGSVEANVERACGKVSPTAALRWVAKARHVGTADRHLVRTIEVGGIGSAEPTGARVDDFRLQRPAGAVIRLDAENDLWPGPVGVGTALDHLVFEWVRRGAVTSEGKHILREGEGLFEGLDADRTVRADAEAEERAITLLGAVSDVSNDDVLVAELEFVDVETRRGRDVEAIGLGLIVRDRVRFAVGTVRVDPLGRRERRPVRGGAERLDRRRERLLPTFGELAEVADEGDRPVGVLDNARNRVRAARTRRWRNTDDRD